MLYYTLTSNSYVFTSEISSEKMSRLSWLPVVSTVKMFVLIPVPSSIANVQTTGPQLERRLNSLTTSALPN